jgi:hypothetical protein
MNGDFMPNFNALFQPMNPVRVQVRSEQLEAETCIHYNGQVTVDERDLKRRFGKRVLVQKKVNTDNGVLHASATFQGEMTARDMQALLDLSESFRQRLETESPVRPPLASQVTPLRSHAPRPRLQALVSSFDKAA